MSGRNNHPERIRVAKVINTHGVHGEVKAIPLSDFPERYAYLKRVFVEGDEIKECTVQSARWNKNMLLLKFEGIENANDAALLKNKYLAIDRQEAVLLPEDEYYIFEIIGMEVVDINGQRIGTIKDVLQNPANDVYVIRDEENREILVPALKSIVKQVDLERKTMIVELPPGLVD